MLKHGSEIDLTKDVVHSGSGILELEPLKVSLTLQEHETQTGRQALEQDNDSFENLEASVHSGGDGLHLQPIMVPLQRTESQLDIPKSPENELTIAASNTEVRIQPVLQKLKRAAFLSYIKNYLSVTDKQSGTVSPRLVPSSSENDHEELVLTQTETGIVIPLEQEQLVISTENSRGDLEDDSQSDIDAFSSDISEEDVHDIVAQDECTLKQTIVIILFVLLGVCIGALATSIFMMRRYRLEAASKDLPVFQRPRDFNPLELIRPQGGTAERIYNKIIKTVTRIDVVKNLRTNQIAKRVTWGRGIQSYPGWIEERRRDGPLDTNELYELFLDVVWFIAGE